MFHDTVLINSVLLHALFFTNSWLPGNKKWTGKIRDSIRPGVIVICNSNDYNCSSNRWNRMQCTSNSNCNRK